MLLLPSWPGLIAENSFMPTVMFYIIHGNMLYEIIYVFIIIYTDHECVVAVGCMCGPFIITGLLAALSQLSVCDLQVIRLFAP